MDLAVAWYQEEQEGEAKRIWSNIWETAEMVRIKRICVLLNFHNFRDDDEINQRIISKDFCYFNLPAINCYQGHKVLFI